jgi:hypothetical protein
MTFRITTLTPTGTLGYGFESEALRRGLEMAPDVIAVDAGSTDPGPYYLGSNEPLVSEYSIRRELEELVAAARKRNIPLIVGSAGGAGTKVQVNQVAQIVRDIAQSAGLHFRLATIYADIDIERAKVALRRNEIVDFEAGFALTEEHLDTTTSLVAQMGHEPICAALDKGADVIIAGRSCDDLAIAAYAIWRGADPARAIHMGKILECGAFSAEPFGMDVMVGILEDDYFILEPGSPRRRASVKSVAAHSLYEREHPYAQDGPGHRADLSHCTFEQISERQVRVRGAVLQTTDYYIKLEGARRVGSRSIAIAGIRCPTAIERIDQILDDVREQTLRYFEGRKFSLNFHVYGRNGVMKSLEVEKDPRPHELGLVIDVVAPNEEEAHSICHNVSGRLLHHHYPGMKNTAGNLAFPYSPSDLDVGAVYEFSVYHLMKVKSALEMFPIHVEEI